jgi:dihydrofolate reductase
MSKIIVYNFITVDGYFSGPNGELNWHQYDEEMGQLSKEQMKTFSALIFGRTTYEMMAGYWPTTEAASEPDVAQALNNLPKLVFSSSMEQVADGPVWKNVKVFSDIDPQVVQSWKSQYPDGDIAIFGSGSIVQQFTKLGLIDEYRLMVNPLILGKGKLLFQDVDQMMDLKLVRTKQYKNGNVFLVYQKA